MFFYVIPAVFTYVRYAHICEYYYYRWFSHMCSIVFTYVSVVLTYVNIVCSYDQITMEIKRLLLCNVAQLSLHCVLVVKLLGHQPISPPEMVFVRTTLIWIHENNFVIGEVKWWVWISLFEFFCHKIVFNLRKCIINWCDDHVVHCVGLDWLANPV